jgi:3-hydroxyisobutyrate dehydrogenase
MTTVGFIGTGNIGNPMARHLIEAGHDVVLNDLRQEAAENLLELGATWAASPAEVAKACRIVFTSLPGPPEVEAVVSADDGILAGAQSGDVHIDLSSNSITTVRRLVEREALQGVHYIDSPVTGGVRGADKGTLTLLASGDRDAFDRVEPLLQAIGSNIFHLGDAGTGCIVKLINNLIVLCTGQIAQEGLVLGTKAGLDPAQLYELLKVGTAAPMVKMLPYSLGRRFDNPSFTLALAEKDVSLALELARTMQVPMPVTSAAHQTYLRAVANGLGEKSFMATLEALEASAGVTVPQVDLDEGQARL